MMGPDPLPPNMVHLTAILCQDVQYILNSFLIQPLQAHVVACVSCCKLTLYFMSEVSVFPLDRGFETHTQRQTANTTGYRSFVYPLQAHVVF